MEFIMFIIEWAFDKLGYEKKSSFAWTFPAIDIQTKPAAKKAIKKAKPIKKPKNG
jgi:hypothetical protein